MAQGPLTGVRVLDITEGVAGPYCTRLMAAYGAEVIKVERPEKGDWTRHRAPFAEGKPGLDRSILFSYLNASKRSLMLSLDTESGQSVVRRLAEKAELVVESFPAGYLEERGLGPERLREVKPPLVITSVPMFERGSPFENYQMTELNIYAMSGLMSIVGAGGKPPIKAGGYQAQYMTGAHACALALFAVHSALATGQGSWVETSTLESSSKIFAHMVDYTIAGANKERADVRRERANAVMPCLDGYMTVTLYYFQMKELGELLGIPDMGSDPRFSSEDKVRENQSALKEEVRKWLSTRTAEQAQTEAQARHLLFTKVNTTKDLAESEHLRAREFFRAVQHPKLGEIEYPGLPFIMSEAKAPPTQPAPSLGEANDYVLRDLLSLSTSELKQLQAQGAD